MRPILFVIFVNDLSEYIPEVNIIQFVDDITIQFESRDIERILKMSLASQSRALKWFEVNGLSMNHSKTQNMVLSLRDTGEHLGSVPSVKLLGLRIDNSITWSVHVDDLSSTLSRSIFVQDASLSLYPKTANGSSKDFRGL